MKKDVVAMVLVGGRGTRLKQITLDTAKPAVTFGGKYRLIDFVLSNLSNSKIDTAGIITQYEPHSLMNYISLGSTWDLDVNEGGVHFLTPYTSMDGDQWQKGTAHAIMQHFHFIDQYNPKYVLILGGDHVYKMDYNKMIQHHEDLKADLTIATFKVTDNPSRYGILESDEFDKVISFEEKPEVPKCNQASMGIYVFNTEVLRQLVFERKHDLLDFGKDIIPYSLKHDYQVYTYKFPGYFRDVGTVESLFEANMDLIDNPQLLKLHEYVDFPIYTKSSNLPPHHFGEKCIVNNSLISDGCLIYGDVYHSILSSGTYIAKQSIVKNSMLYQNVRLEENVEIENAIILKDLIIPPNTKLIFDKITIVDNELLGKLGENNG